MILANDDSIDPQAIAQDLAVAQPELLGLWGAPAGAQTQPVLPINASLA